MSELVPVGHALPPASPEVIERIRRVQNKLMQCEQIHPQMEHVLHAGMYARTCRLDPGVIIIGVLVKIPTMLVVHGNCEVFAGDRWYAIKDYQAIPARAGRKQVYITHGVTEITMIFSTKAKTVAEAEVEFTDETADLLSRRQDNNDLVIITGEQ